MLDPSKDEIVFRTKAPSACMKFFFKEKALGEKKIGWICLYCSSVSRGKHQSCPSQCVLRMEEDEALSPLFLITILQSMINFANLKPSSE